MKEESIVRLRREYLDTTVALSNKSSSNPNGWEQVEIRVKGAIFRMLYNFVKPL